MTMTDTMRRFVLAARPEGEPGPEHFRLETAPLPDPGEGQILARTILLSLDPYMRGRMSAARSYAKPVEVGALMEGQVVAEVIASRSPRWKTGDVVVAPLGWATHGVCDAEAAFRTVPGVPLGAALGVMGMPGLTAWVGLNDIAGGKAGETIVVSAATGAVGGVVGQLARAKGMRVIGVAGGAEKCAYAVAELGYHACLDHKAMDARTLSRAISEAAPDGVDAYFENVGGTVLEAVLPRMNTFGRIALCGMIAWYSGFEGAPPAPLVWGAILRQRLRVQGFIVTDHQNRTGAFAAEVAPMILSGALKWRETVAEGLEAAPAAFASLLRGDNFGKQLVRVGADPV